MKQILHTLHLIFLELYIIVHLLTTEYKADLLDLDSLFFPTVYMLEQSHFTDLERLLDLSHCIIWFEIKVRPSSC